MIDVSGIITDPKQQELMSGHGRVMAVVTFDREDGTEGIHKFILSSDRKETELASFWRNQYRLLKSTPDGITGIRLTPMKAYHTQDEHTDTPVKDYLNTLGEETPVIIYDGCDLLCYGRAGKILAAKGGKAGNENVIDRDIAKYDSIAGMVIIHLT